MELARKELSYHNLLQGADPTLPNSVVWRQQNHRVCIFKHSIYFRHTEDIEADSPSARTNTTTLDLDSDSDSEDIVLEILTQTLASTSLA